MNSKKLSGLFVNCIEAQDSIFESGKMVFQCLLDSEKFSLDYVEIDKSNRSISTNYHFYLFNYHVVTMSWLDTKSIKKLLPGVKMTIVLEVSPNDPFVYCSPEDFDAYCVLDPTLNEDNKKVFAFPRPLEKFDGVLAYEEKDQPIIGSFGFATKGKGFEHLIDAVNREFDRAIVRINIPFATYADETHVYAKELAETCKSKAKDGIEVIVTHDFMSKPELIKWCGENTLNCFLYDRNFPGLAATTDQAITSGRPLSISKNNTFRHIQKYIKPFPYQTLKEAIANTQEDVREMQKQWSPEQFRTKFETVLEEFDFDLINETHGLVELPLKEVEEGAKPPGRVLANMRRLRNIGKIKSKIRSKFTPKKTSYSQFGEDVIIDNLRKDLAIQNFTYLDVGANNPQYISNTYLFYEKGFSGILVEPNAYLCDMLRKERPRDKVLNVGVGIDKNVTEADFYLFPKEADGLSTFSLDEAKHWETVGMGDKKFKVEQVLRMPLMQINDIISEHFTECPDFISIDVEGWDLEILKTLDFDRYNPAVFCVETLAYKQDGSTYRIKEANEFFETKGYFAFQETYANTIFVNRNLYDFYLYQKKQSETR